MNEVYYVCQWGNNRERAWSGTYLALFNELSKQCKLIDIGAEQHLSTKIKLKLYGKYNFVKYDFSYDDIKNFNPWSENLIPKANADILTFFEMDFPPEDRVYIYQDMCIDYIDNVILKDERLKTCFRKNVSKKIIDIRKIKQKEFYSKCNGIFVMGEWLKKYIVDKMGISGEKIHCVGAGFDIDCNKYNPTNRQKNKLLFIGVDYERKAGPLVVDAFRVLREKYQRDAELYIVGPKQLNMDSECEGIHYVGNVSSKKVTEYYNLCDVLCVPSYLEPFGKVYIEALAFGMPVIARNAFATPDFITSGKNGFLIDDDDVEDLARKMFDSLHNEEIMKNVKDDMLRIREYYSWDAVARRINEVINSNRTKL